MGNKQELNNIEKVPQHIAIIPDGNRRWSTSKFGNKYLGHIKGLRNILKITQEAIKYNVQYITFYLLSKENLKNREEKEVILLLNLIKKIYNPLIANSYNKLISFLQKEKIQIKILGNIDNMDIEIKEKFTKAGFKIPEDIHKINIIKVENPKIYLQLCINYSAQNEIVEAFKKLYNTENFNINNISYEVIQNALYTAKIPDPDLLIRTGGELRISNFLLLQLAYTELYFSEKMWPDFNSDDFMKTIIDFSKRNRRIGK